MIIKRSAAFCVLAVALLADASAIEFSNVVVAGKRVTICRVNVHKERLQLLLKDDEGRPFKSFDAIDRWLQSRDQKLLFGMNAGMYHRDFSPVGLFVAGGQQLAPLNTNSGTGNFYLKPNGVFLVSEKGARVLESSEYSGLSEQVMLATQSGPLLVHRGKIHPGFNPRSESRLIRNGVGVPSQEMAVFAISDAPISFYEFATLFRDVLKCPDALFLDGVISSLHSIDLKRSDKKTELGPMIGITREVKKH